ncbi:unnamed protein product [Polarella glacialis]|uniref:Serine/threonine specific protein phosphatases domain-containing protein n=2 Tax=Polarella glacialis TaxID=89957 RepID=A0A813JI65_POLGL|nr:unnamed protein product [Polarella glacialis]
MPLKHLLGIRGFVNLRTCGLCDAEIPRVAPRHRCRRCDYNVCYDCAMRLTIRSAKSHFDLSACQDHDDLVAAQKKLSELFWQSEARRQNRRSMLVRISKYYDSVSLVTGEIQMHRHSRKRKAVADDCHISYADVCFAVHATLDQETVPAEPESRGPGDTGESSGHALALGVVLPRMMQLIDVLSNEVDQHVDCLDLDWDPILPPDSKQGLPQPSDSPQQNVDGQPQGDSLLSWLLGGSDQIERLFAICTAAQEVLESQPVVPEVSVPAKVFGDLHGQLRDLLLFFCFYGCPGQESREWANVSYVFNGDWVDRGRHQLEVVVVLLALKLVFPARVWLTRGNHEDMEQNRKTSREGGLGFDKACAMHFGPRGPEVFQAFYKCFDWLPLAASIGGRALVLHGGLGDGSWTLDMLRSVQRPIVSAELVTALDGVVYNVIWSDPLQADPASPVDTFGVHTSARAKHKTTMKAFGRDVTQTFCARENLALIIRSHQFKRSGKGYEVMHDGLLMRVFSARNYMGRHQNDGGVLLLGWAEGTPDTLLVRPQVIERRFKRGPSAGAGQRDDLAEPYCPQEHLMREFQPCRPNPSLGCLTSLRSRKEKEEEVIGCGECKISDSSDAEAIRFFYCRVCSYYLCSPCALKSAHAAAAPMQRAAGSEDAEPSESSESSETPELCDLSEQGDDSVAMLQL